MNLKLISFASLLFLIVFSSAYAQKKLSQVTPILYLPQGYVTESFNGYGYSNVVCGSVQNLSNSNPALLAEVERISMGLSMHYETKIKESWIADIHHERENNWIPQSFGFAINLDHVCIGAGFHQKFVSTLDYGKFSGVIIDPSDPSGYSEVGRYHAWSETRLINYALIIGFVRNNVWSEGDRLSFGLRATCNHVKYGFYNQSESSNDNLIDQDMNIRKNLHGWSYSLGMVYVRKKLSAGWFFEKGCLLEDRLSFENMDFTIAGETPDKLFLGYRYQLFPNLDFNHQIHVVFWENTDLRRYQFRNQIEFSINLIGHWTPDFSTSIGIYHTDHQYKEAAYPMKMNAYYLTFGFVYKYKCMGIDFIIADSHWQSDSWRKQTIGRLGLTISF